MFTSIKSSKSEVWNFFNKKGDGICACSLCGRTYKTGGGTTNLKNHLLHKHASCLQEGKILGLNSAKKRKLFDVEVSDANKKQNEVKL